ncbi:MAG: CHRD domain-containing protein [Vicinamibacterales bacterium]
MTFPRALIAVAPAMLLAAAPSAAQGVRFETTMTGAAVNPPNGSPGTGTVVVTMDTAAHVLGVGMTFAGLQGLSTTAHIHCCAETPGTGSAGVATMTPSFVGFPAGVTAGTMSQQYDTSQASAFNSSFVNANGGTPEGAEAALVAGLLAGRAYVDIHSAVFAAGEIRGFLAVVPELRVSDVTQAEGSGGTTSFTFTVSLTPAAPGPVTVVAATADGTATAPTDYAAAGPATLTFNAGETSKPFQVLVGSDTLAEPDETFFVQLSSPGGAVIVDAQGIGTILNDDAPPLPPMPATGLRVIAMSGNTVTFAWNPPELGAAPTGYQIEGGTSPGGVLAALTLDTAPMFTVALPSGALYVRVRTISGGLVSGPSNEVLVHVNEPLPPSAPANLLGVVSGTSLALAWRNTFEGGALTSLVLDVAGSLVMSAPLPPGDTFGYTGVPPGTYTLRVRAVNAFGTSAPSNPVALTFPGGCSGAPQPVQNFIAFATPGRLVLSWDPAGTGAAPTGFIVNSTGAYVGSVPLASRGIAAAVPPGSYTLGVAAANPCGASAVSAARTVTVP